MKAGPILAWALFFLFAVWLCALQGFLASPGVLGSWTPDLGLVWLLAWTGRLGRGRVLVQDEDRRAVVLIYRDFRREHPLGQVAHARSLLAGRPIDLAETRAHLVPWAKELLAHGTR